jgi:signal transduction histidine kinase
MDRKTGLILNLGKYGGYMAVLWVSVITEGISFKGPFLPFLIIFTLDNIRTFYLDNKYPAYSIPSLYIQLLAAYIFIFMDGTSVGGILLIILIAESLLAYKSPTGEYIFIFAITGFIAVSAAGFYWRNTLNWDNMAVIMINALFFLFAYAVSYLARRQTEERERAEAALEQLDRSRADLEKAYLKLIEVSKEREQLAAVEERTRIARELHDTLAHTLTAIIVTLEAGKKLVTREPQKALDELKKSQEQARKGLEEVRLTVKSLRSDPVETLGFPDALKGLIRDYEGSGVSILLNIEEGIELPENVELVIYRIAQESITNGIRHGQASTIKINLQQLERKLLLEIEDNGKGSTELQEGYGLQGIRERAATIGGAVSFTNLQPQGFLVRMLLEDF